MPARFLSSYGAVTAATLLACAVLTTCGPIDAQARHADRQAQRHGAVMQDKAGQRLVPAARRSAGEPVAPHEADGV